MDAKRVAGQVRKMGFPVLEVTEADEQTDASVVITAAVSIQVPTFGVGVSVVRRHGDEFHFHDCGAVSALAPLIKQALADAEAAGPAPESEDKPPISGNAQPTIRFTPFRFLPALLVARLQETGWTRDAETGEVSHPEYGDGFVDWMDAALICIDKAHEYAMKDAVRPDSQGA